MTTQFLLCLLVDTQRDIPLPTPTATLLPRTLYESEDSPSCAATCRVRIISTTSKVISLGGAEELRILEEVVNRKNHANTSSMGRARLVTYSLSPSRTSSYLFIDVQYSTSISAVSTEGEAGFPFQGSKILFLPGSSRCKLPESFIEV